MFELNTQDYPNSWNVWDSLGEAHMNAGNTAKAIESYQRSLEINPGNTNGQAMLEKLRGERGGPHPLDRFASQLRWNPGS